ncbi:hypothetical protein A1D22_06355 [Pasteurellaceae bacterium LFhippo2]|nr:hypothetical protein [Pasteurellaceae bacterium LFhippo2]
MFEAISESQVSSNIKVVSINFDSDKLFQAIRHKSDKIKLESYKSSDLQNNSQIQPLAEDEDILFLIGKPDDLLSCIKAISEPMIISCILPEFSNQDLSRLEQENNSIYVLNNTQTAESEICELIFRIHQHITEESTKEGSANVIIDVIDLKGAFKDAPYIKAISAAGYGENKIQDILETITSQCNSEIKSNSIVVSIVADENLELGEVFEIMETIYTLDFVNEDATILFGTSFNKDMEDSLSITLYIGQDKP